MSPQIILLPLDERPCNQVYPQYIAAIGGVECLVPPCPLLGRFKQPADVEGLWEWLFAHAGEATHLVVSMDLMVYGGIVPSRLHHLSAETCAERVGRLARLKALYPHLAIYAFQLITRAPARNGAGEEPDYYEQHGYDIHRYGVVTDMEALGVAGERERAEKRGILERVPQACLDDFTARRKVNFATDLQTIELAAQKVIDHLIIPLEDCKEYGYAPAERRALARHLAQKNLLSAVAMYPGADEIGCTLTARAVCDVSGVSPAIWLDYDSGPGRLTVPAYEDRTIGETAPHHVLNSGARLALSPLEADCAMLIHPPTAFTQRLEKELDRREIYLECERNLPLLALRIRQYAQRGIPCFLADCAIPNGADKCLMQFLSEQDLLCALQGYAGWNTSSNALGTVMAHAVAYACAKQTGRLAGAAQKSSEEFRLYRYLEDWGYMVEVRKTLTEMLPDIGPGLSFLSLGGCEPQVAERASEMLCAFARRYFPDCAATPSVCMPWNRMFEVALRLNK